MGGASKCYVIATCALFILGKNQGLSHFENIEAFKESRKIIKDLNDKAFEDHCIRKALDEVEVWSILVSFKLVDHFDAAGATVSTVKEWKQNFSELVLALTTKLEKSHQFIHVGRQSNSYSIFEGVCGAFYQVQRQDTDLGVQTY